MDFNAHLGEFLRVHIRTRTRAEKNNMFQVFALARDRCGHRGVVDNQDLRITHDRRDLLWRNVRLSVNHVGDVIGLV